MNKLLLETIKIENCKIYNILYHQKRFDDSRYKLFYTKDKMDLKDFIDPPKNGLFRCRVLYNKEIRNIEYIPYVPKIFKKFKVIPSDIEYPFKYANRSDLEELRAKYPDFDEIIIEKNGLLSDTTISNIAFFDGYEWITPASPLLNGTMRAKLIDEGFLKVKDIKANEIKNYTKFALINAMMGFIEIENFYIEI